MDTRLKKSNRTLYVTFYVVCVCSFLACIISIVAAATLNGFSWYADPYVIQQGGYIGFESFLSENGDHLPDIWKVMEKHMEVWLVMAVGFGILALLSLIYLVLSVGERDESGKILLSRFDYVFSEVQLVCVCILFLLGGALFTKMVEDVLTAVYELGNTLSTFDLVLQAVFSIIIGLVSAFLGLGLGLSCVKKIKAGEFLNRSIFGLVFFSLYAGVYKSGSPMRRIVLMLVLICLLSATVFLAPVILIMILVFSPKWVQRYEEIRKGLDEVNNGNLNYKIPVRGEDELDQLAIGINKISEATSIAVQNELKNQRMKTDLISNVSHDLKTPLTSMVTYIDLLKTEGLDSENAPKYLDILQKKTERLRQLTEDLFEAAKASSGATPVHMSRVDLLSLLNQGLGELNERVEESSLDFVVTAEQERYFVKADGQLLWRVISNLLGNVLKYSQEHTRVYINFTRKNTETEKLVFMEIKNISKQSLNMDPSELMERFKRGDESRSTEGSGLGLAIAKDLMRLMEGWIDIAIDGDLFKAKIMLKAASDKEPAADINGMGSGSGADRSGMDFHANMDFNAGMDRSAGMNVKAGVNRKESKESMEAAANMEPKPERDRNAGVDMEMEAAADRAMESELEMGQKEPALYETASEPNTGKETAYQEPENPGSAVSQGNLQRLRQKASQT